MNGARCNHAHALGQAQALLSAAPAWAGLGPTDAARQAWWRRWVHEPLTARELGALRHSLTSGRPFGSASWVTAMVPLLGLQLTPKRRGRPLNQQQAQTAAEK